MIFPQNPYMIYAIQSRFNIFFLIPMYWTKYRIFYTNESKVYEYKA